MIKLLMLNKSKVDKIDAFILRSSASSMES